jgi:serine/threonine protein kinase/formylglycine-generating enzyme required for sulfatase activity
MKKRPQAHESYGDDRTVDGNCSGQGIKIDDSEVVDLEARYTVEGTLGQGGMGEVLLATDTRLDRKVAIKRILGEAAGNAMAVQRFLTEAKAIARLNHPNIVQIYDYGRTKDGPFLIMEYVDGGSLLDRCREAALPLNEAIELACQLCDGLSRAHDLGIIHRDIKPANVLLTRDGIAKVADFGLAKTTFHDRGQTATGGVLGTHDFMSPEQRRDSAAVDSRSDLWSLAATVYQMVTGRSPKIIWFDRLPGELTDVLGRALHEARESRYESVRDFKNALMAFRNRGGATIDLACRQGVLKEGQCEACGTLSDPARKFCRNPACGVSLRTNCLKCEVVMPVWEVICGECGGNQSDAVAELRESLSRKRTDAESRLAALELDEATALANELGSVAHPRAADYAEWGRSFVKTVEDTRLRQVEFANQQYEAAMAHRAACDYPAAIQALESVPLTFRTEAAVCQLDGIRENYDEAKSLIERIRTHIERNETDELWPLVRRAVELRRDRADLKAIYDTLTERGLRQYAPARAALDAGDVAAAKKCFPSDESLQYLPDDGGLRAWISDATERESELAALVQGVKKDGTVSVEKLAEIVQAAEKVLCLVPNSTKAKTIAQQASSALAKRDPEFAAAQEKRRDEEQQREITRQEIIARPVVCNAIGAELRFLPGGVWSGHDGYGSTEAEPGVHTLISPFFFGVYPVTNAQWKRLMEPSSSLQQGDDHPVRCVNWHEATEFCRRLSALPEEIAAGRVYRLPTVAEWHFACNADTTTRYSFGDNAYLYSEYGYGAIEGAFFVGSLDSSHPVGRKKPNPWGIFDMYGNIHEWCSDEIAPWRGYTGAEGVPRAIRGGDNPRWNCGALGSGESLRREDMGFRLVMQTAGVVGVE